MPSSRSTSRPDRYIPLHPKQIEFLDSTAIYRAFIGGRGSGKSWAGCYDLIRRARPGRTYLLASPTYPMLFDSELRTFVKLARELGVLADLKQSAPANAKLTNGAEILFRSADDPERLRGPNLSGAVLMEAAQMHRDAYDICIACLREEGEQGWLSILTTPQGPLHWTYEVFATGTRPDTALFRAATSENPFNPADFAATLARQYGDSLYAKQELGGEFIQMEGATFPAEWLSDLIFVPEWPEGVTHSVLYLDPSQGKDAGGSDYQAFVRAGFRPGVSRENVIYLECVAGKEDPVAMVARGVRLCRQWRPDLFAFEVNATMGMLHAEVNRQLREHRQVQRIWPVQNTDPKLFRIRNVLISYLAQGRVRIVDNPGGRQLRAELQSHPAKDAHDDCADGAAGAVALLEQLVRA